MTRTARIDAAAAIALFLFALAFRVALLAYTRYDGLYGLDAYAYFDYVAQLRPALLGGHAPPPFHWPLGYPLLCFVVSLITGPTALAGQAASVLCGALCPPLLYWLVLQCQPKARTGAFLAALLLAAAFYSVSLSVSYMSDLPALAWALLSANLMLRYLQALRPRWLVLAALTLAAALLTRWVYALLVVPFGLAALTAYAQQRPPARRIAAHAALAIAAGGMVLALHFAPSLLRDDAKVAYAGNLRDYSWSPANFYKTEFDTNDGHMSWPKTPAHYYLQPLRDGRYILPVFTPLLALGVFALLRRAPGPVSVMIVAWAVAFYLFFAGVYMENYRFPLSYFPPLLVAFALGVEAFASMLGAGRAVFGLTVATATWIAWQGGLPTGLLLMTLAPIAGIAVRPQRARLALALVVVLCAIPEAKRTVDDLWWTQTRVIPREKDLAQWAATLVPADKVILAQGNSMILAHTIPQRVIDLYNLGEEERDALFKHDRVVYLMVDPDAIAKQWANARPQQHLDWIHAYTRVTELATRERYHLFKAELP